MTSDPDFLTQVAIASEEERKKELAEAEAAAEHGDMRPARALVDRAVKFWLRASPSSSTGSIPNLSRFLQPPKPGRGRGKRHARDYEAKLRDIAYVPGLAALKHAACRAVLSASDQRARRLWQQMSELLVG